MSLQSRPATREHVARFYESEAELSEAAVGYLLPALRGDGAAIVIATPSHRERFSRALADDGIDVASLVSEGRLLLLDAEQTLAQISMLGKPAARAFDELVGSRVRTLAARHGELVAFGEMVALLWDAGEVIATLELEKLWCALQDEVDFSLMCAYRRSIEADTSRLEQVACLHSEVIGDGPLLEGAQASRCFTPGRRAPHEARSFVAAVLSEWGMAELVEQAGLIVSELATNAIVHASSPPCVSLVRLEDGVRIGVGDRAAAAPAPRERAASGGRGLLLVGALARDWGYQRSGEGKLVWAELGVRS